MLGRNLGPSDSPDGQKPQPVAELHYRFWQRHFHGDPAILGKTLELEHKKYTIVGVTRPNFAGGWGTECICRRKSATLGYAGVMVKLRPGVSWAAADAELTPLLERLRKSSRTIFRGNSR